MICCDHVIVKRAQTPRQTTCWCNILYSISSVWYNGMRGPVSDLMSILKLLHSLTVEAAVLHKENFVKYNIFFIPLSLCVWSKLTFFLFTTSSQVTMPTCTSSKTFSSRLLLQSAAPEENHQTWNKNMFVVQATSKLVPSMSKLMEGMTDGGQPGARLAWHQALV